MDQEKVLNITREYAAAVRKVVDATAISLYGSSPRTATLTLLLLWIKFPATI